MGQWKILRRHGADDNGGRRDDIGPGVGAARWIGGVLQAGQAPC
ncbi:hypothetical protein [Pseudomonas fluorescens]|nr:hypothetical protein [Pseudomonas fluorescens]